MYYIALCDDKEEELEKAESMLKIYKQQHSDRGLMIRKFQKAADLLEAVRDKTYMPDLVLMDIFMPGELGVDAARKLREMGSGCEIVFQTVTKEFALEAFSVDAVQYLLKPVAQDELFLVLDKLWKKRQKEEQKFLVIRVGNSICRIPVQEITYVEAQKKFQNLYLSDGTQYMLRLTMAKIYEMLSEHEAFVKAGVSYIINLIHVKSISAQSVKLDNGMQIYLPRGAYPGLKEQYFRFYCTEDDC